LSEEARAVAFAQAAAAYSRLGWACIRCDGKRPRGKGWQNEAPGPADFVSGKWSRWGERFNLGIVLGSSGLAVVEPDIPEAEAELRELLGGELPKPPTAQSGGRSLHLYFRDGGQGNASRGGLELRAGGQMVVAPPSVHPETGRPYRWLEGREPWALPLAPIPEAVLAHFAGALNGERAAVEPVAEEIHQPGRHKALLSLAGSMRRRGMVAEEIAVALLAVNASRCKPPLPEREVVELAADVARRYEPARDVEQERAEREAERLLAGVGRNRGQNGAGGSAPALIVPLADYLAGAEDEAAWIVDHLVGRGALSLVAGLPKVGKSTFVYGMLGAITASANGGAFLGLPVQAAAALLLTEEPPATVEEKADRFGLADERVFVLPKRGARAGRSWAKLAEAVLEFCREHPEVRVVVVDTLDKFADLTAKRSESDTGVIRETIDPLYPILDLGAAVVLITHQRKEEGSFGLRVRGGTSLTGSADVIVEVERPPESAGLGREARVVKLVSRFTDAPDEIAVELGEGGWRSIGTVAAAVRRMRQEEVLALFDGDPLTVDEFLGVAKGRLSRRTLQRRLGALERDGLVARLGEGVRGDPHRFALTDGGRIFLRKFLRTPSEANFGELPKPQEASGFVASKMVRTAEGGGCPSFGAQKRAAALAECLTCERLFDPAEPGSTGLRCPDCAARGGA
jgi:KaiC/GvpD/RAD55 family RecA-like ATPase